MSRRAGLQQRRASAGTDEAHSLQELASGPVAHLHSRQGEAVVVRRVDFAFMRGHRPAVARFADQIARRRVPLPVRISKAGRFPLPVDFQKVGASAGDFKPARRDRQGGLTLGEAANISGEFRDYLKDIG